MKGGRRQGRQKKKWEDSIRVWTGLEFGKSQRAVENREKWRKLVAKSSVVPQQPSRLGDRWWWRWWSQTWSQIINTVLCLWCLKHNSFTRNLWYLKHNSLTHSFTSAVSQTHFINSVPFVPLRSSLAGNLARLTWVRLQQLQEQCYPFLTVCAVFLCVQRKVQLPKLGIFHVHKDVNACKCTWRLYGHCKRVCIESQLWGKIPCCYRGTEPASVASWSVALPTELHPCPHMWYRKHISVRHISASFCHSSNPISTHTVLHLSYLKHNSFTLLYVCGISTVVQPCVVLHL